MIAWMNEKELLSVNHKESPCVSWYKTDYCTVPVYTAESLSDNYIQHVPEHCDRIVWRGFEYYLPNLLESK